MLELRKLNISDEKSFRDAVADFNSCHSGFIFAPGFDEKTNFTDYVQQLINWSQGKDLNGLVPNTFLVAVVNSKIVGRVSIRHELNDFLLREGGHVGYGVVPSERNKGYAKEILRLTLPIAKSLGLNQILLTCNDDNEGSWRTIESNKGVLENKITTEGTRIVKRRYWINLSEIKN